MWSVPSRDYVKRLTARLGKNRGGQSFFTTKRPPYGSSRTTGRALILYGVQKKNAGFSLQLGACGDQSLAVLVALVLGEVLHEAAGQILCLLFPLSGICVGVAGIEDGGIDTGQSGGDLKVEVGVFVNGVLNAIADNLKKEGVLTKE